MFTLKKHKNVYKASAFLSKNEKWHCGGRLIITSAPLRGADKHLPQLTKANEQNRITTLKSEAAKIWWHAWASKFNE